MAHRVLIAQFMHETNTLSKLVTTLADLLVEMRESIARKDIAGADRAFNEA